MGKLIRIVFAVCSLFMLGIFVWRVTHGEWSTVNWVMLAIAATAGLLVFVRFVYIFNFSYALCAIFNGALIWIARPSLAVALVAGAAILYGLRLLWFTWMRTRSDSYAPRMDSVAVADREMPAIGKISLWFMCTWLLTFHLMAVWLAAGVGQLTTGIVIGAAVMLTGTVLEGVADWQKQCSKRLASNQFVATGLFARSRHPNFLGEIVFQAGLIIVALSSAVTSGDIFAGMIAPAYIVILMISESRRVDAYHATRYGADPDYQAYRARSGSLLPKL